MQRSLLFKKNLRISNKEKIRETPKCSRIFLRLRNARCSYFSETVLRNPKLSLSDFWVEHRGLGSGRPRKAAVPCTFAPPLGQARL